MTELLRPYVPSVVIDWLRETPETAHRRIDGSLVFADISGFTNLTERLAKRGKVGAEEMGDLLNATFESLLIPAYEYGGALVKWGGDAVLLLFQHEEHLERAVRAATEMQRVIKRVGRLRTSAGLVTLRMSVGVHCGDIDLFLAGSGHRELIVTGAAASDVAEMEKIADAGEIVVSPAAAMRLPLECLGDLRLHGRLLSRAPEVGQRPRTSPDPHAAPDLGSVVPGPVRTYLEEGITEYEHRQVVAGFVSFAGADRILAERGADALAVELSSVVDAADRAAQDFGVTILATDLAADGGKVIFAAGVPRSLGQDEDRLLAALRAVLAVNTSLVLRAGANSGRVFTGDFGPPYRRTYSVVGDSVNLAARLMAHATPGQLVVTNTTLAGCRTRFGTDALPPFRVKGKSEPINACVVGPPVAASPFDGAREEAFPFVGREPEVVALHAALADARSGQGRLVDIVAEAGLGKSRLVEEAFDELGVGRLQVACDIYESSTPYAPIARFLRGLLGLSADDPDESVVARLADTVERSGPELRPWLPLVATALGVSVPTTPEVEALSENFRKTRLGATLVSLVEAVAIEPRVFVFEDVHHMDEASVEILRLIDDVLPVRPWLIVVTRRPTEDGFVPKDRSHVTAMWLTPLPDEASGAILDHVADEVALPEHELALIREHSGGNPLYIRELLAARRNLGDLESLPDSLEGVITAQIDALPSAARRLLVAAAVLGMTVDRPMLEELLAADDMTVDDHDWAVLEQYLAAEDARWLRFRHALVREAAYESLPFRRRRVLHDRAGEAIERACATPDDDELASLSFHFSSAQRHDKALVYSRLAARHAQARYANAEAARFYRRAVDAAAGLTTLSGEERADLLEALGDVWYLMGDLGKAADAYRAGYRFVRADPLLSGRFRLHLGRVAYRTGRYADGLRVLTRGLGQLEVVDGAEAVACSARHCVLRAQIRMQQGRDDDALRWAEVGAGRALDVDAKDALAQAYQLIDMIHLARGRFDDDDRVRTALAIWEELGDLTMQAALLNHFGMRAYFQGDWTVALDYYERSRVMLERTGDFSRAAIAAWNIAEIHMDQGRIDEAAEITRSALRVFRASEMSTWVAKSESMLGRAASAEGRFDEALGLFDVARATFVAEGDTTEVIECDTRVAECLLMRGDPEAALDKVADLLGTVSDEEGVAPVIPLLHRVRGLALALRCEWVGGRAALESSLVAARLRRSDHDVAFAIEAMARVASADGGRPVHPELVVERDAIVERLGIVRIAPVESIRMGPPLPRPRPVVAAPSFVVDLTSESTQASGR